MPLLLQQHSCCLTNCVLTSFGVRWSVTTLSVRPSDIICGWINISTHWYFWSHVLSLYTVSAAYMIQSEPTANVMSFTAWSRQTCLVSYMVQRFCTLSNRLITPVCFWPCLLWSTWPQITFSVWSAFLCNRCCTADFCYGRYVWYRQIIRQPFGWNHPW